MENSEGVPFAVLTQHEKIVAEYAGISLLDVYELDVFSYWALLHDGVVWNNAQTEKGREWLNNAWRIAQTEPQTKKLHEKYG